jgi:hypothetical protein
VFPRLDDASGIAFVAASCRLPCGAPNATRWSFSAPC